MDAKKWVIESSMHYRLKDRIRILIWHFIGPHFRGQYPNSCLSSLAFRLLKLIKFNRPSMLYLESFAKLWRVFLFHFRRWIYEIIEKWFFNSEKFKKNLRNSPILELFYPELIFNCTLIVGHAFVSKLFNHHIIDTHL